MSNPPNPELDSIDIQAMVAKAAGNNRRWKNLPFKDGANTYRILPPFGPTALQSRAISAEHFVHWWRREGDKKGFPVLCCKNTDKAGCPICVEVEQLQTKQNTILEPYKDASGKLQKASVPADKADAAAKLGQRIQDIKAGRKYYYNAMSPSGEVGVLPLAKMGGDKLSLKIQKVADSLKFNPVSRTEGCFFVISRTKNKEGRYDFDVEVKTEAVLTPEYGQVMKPVKGPLPKAVLEALDTPSDPRYDLFKLYKTRSAAEIKKLMTESPAESEAPEGEEEEVASATAPRSASGPQTISDDEAARLAAELEV